MARPSITGCGSSVTWVLNSWSCSSIWPKRSPAASFTQAIFSSTTSAAAVAIERGLIDRATIVGLMPTMSADWAARVSSFLPPPPMRIGMFEIGLGFASLSATWKC